MYTYIYKLIIYSCFYKNSRKHQKLSNLFLKLKSTYVKGYKVLIYRLQVSGAKFGMFSKRVGSRMEFQRNPSKINWLVMKESGN